MFALSRPFIVFRLPPSLRSRRPSSLRPLADPVTRSPAGRARLRPRGAAQDGPALRVPARVRARQPPRRPDVPPRLDPLQDRARHPAGAGQGEEPVAERGRAQRRPAAGEGVGGGRGGGGADRVDTEGPRMACRARSKTVSISKRRGTTPNFQSIIEVSTEDWMVNFQRYSLISGLIHPFNFLYGDFIIFFW